MFKILYFFSFLVLLVYPALYEVHLALFLATTKPFVTGSVLKYCLVMKHQYYLQLCCN